MGACIKIGLFWFFFENFVYSRVVEMEEIQWNTPQWKDLQNNSWIVTAAFNGEGTVCVFENLHFSEWIFTLYITVASLGIHNYGFAMANTLKNPRVPNP